MKRFWENEGKLHKKLCEIANFLLSVFKMINKLTTPSNKIPRRFKNCHMQ